MSIQQDANYDMRLFNSFNAVHIPQVFEDIHLQGKPTLAKLLEGLNIFFCFVFFLEFCLKIIGWGVYSYLRNPWNCLDMFIVAVSTF